MWTNDLSRSAAHDLFIGSIIFLDINLHDEGLKIHLSDRGNS